MHNDAARKPNESETTASLIARAAATGAVVRFDYTDYAGSRTTGRRARFEAPRASYAFGVDRDNGLQYLFALARIESPVIEPPSSTRAVDPCAYNAYCLEDSECPDCGCCQSHCECCRTSAARTAPASYSDPFRAKVQAELASGRWSVERLSELARQHAVVHAEGVIYDAEQDLDAIDEAWILDRCAMDWPDMVTGFSLRPDVREAVEYEWACAFKCRIEDERDGKARAEVIAAAVIRDVRKRYPSLLDYERPGLAEAIRSAVERACRATERDGKAGAA